MIEDNTNDNIRTTQANQFDAVLFKRAFNSTVDGRCANLPAHYRPHVAQGVLATLTLRLDPAGTA